MDSVFFTSMKKIVIVTLIHTMKTEKTPFRRKIVKSKGMDKIDNMNNPKNPPIIKINPVSIRMRLIFFLRVNFSMFLKY